MNLRTFAAVTLGAAAVAALAGWAQPDRATQPATKPGQPAGQPPAGMPTPEQMMGMMIQMAEPGPEHARIAQLAGTWNGKVTTMMDPAAPPNVSQGTMTSTLVLGGRQLRQEWKGDFMGHGFEGLGYLGYDNVKKQYHSTWTDTLSTAIMVSTGTYDEASKTYTLTGTVPDPTQPGKDASARSVVKVTGPDSHVMEMYGAGPDGKEMKMMTIEYTRSGGAKPAAAPGSRGGGGGR